MKLFTLHPSIYKLNYYVSLEENLSPEVKELKNKLTHCYNLRKRKVPWNEITAIVGISRSNYFRLNKLTELYGTKGLIQRSKRPRKVRTSLIPATYVELILKLRKENPTYGKAKITVILERDHEVLLSESSVGRILKKLRESGKIKRSYSAWSTRRKRKFDKHAKRWEYGKHRPEMPGETVQVDHMTVTKNNKGFKHFQAWDPLSKYINATVTSNATSHAAKTFLYQLVKEGPFKIVSIQVDGGSEFMDEFESACKELNIALFVLPPKSPKYNGGVERGNRIFREEFYAKNDILADSIGAIKAELKSAVWKYNSYRPHKSLDYLTPMQYLLPIKRSIDQSNML
jgi:putative transposase